MKKINQNRNSFAFSFKAAGIFNILRLFETAGKKWHYCWYFCSYLKKKWKFSLSYLLEEWLELLYYTVALIFVSFFLLNNLILKQYFKASGIREKKISLATTQIISNKYLMQSIQIISNKYLQVIISNKEEELEIYVWSQGPWSHCSPRDMVGHLTWVECCHRWLCTFYKSQASKIK